MGRLLVVRGEAVLVMGGLVVVTGRLLKACSDDGKLSCGYEELW